MEQLTHIPRWQHERNILYVMENLLEVAFTSAETEEKIQQFISKNAQVGQWTIAQANLPPQLHRICCPCEIFSSYEHHTCRDT